MKCLHILPMNTVSGAEKMALNICRNMISYEPVVVCGGGNLRDIFENYNIKSYALSFSDKDILKTVWNLKNIVKGNNIKIIHAHDNNASLRAYLAKKLYRLDVKIISHIHSCYPWLKGSNMNKKIDSFLRNRYDYNIACGKLVYDYYKGNAEYFHPEKMSVLSNAIDVAEIIDVDISKSEEVVRKYNILSDKVILGFIGRLSKEKGIIPFIKEYAVHRKDFTDCRVLLVGDGEQEKEVKDLISELELDELFILTGYQEDVYKFYPIIDIFFLPSLYEGLPMVLLEAMAFKKPMVAMNVGSISEAILEGNNGYLIQKRNYKEFIAALYTLKCDADLRDGYGNNAFEYVKMNFGIEKYNKKLIATYDMLMSIN